MFRRSSDDTGEEPAGKAELTPEEQAAWEAGLERLAEEKRRALAEPGPTWREWFFYDAMKWFLGVVFLIVDAIIATSWIAGGVFSNLSIVGVIASLIPALYLEMLLYLYLWRRPSSIGPSGAGGFRPGWTHLREVGIWTPEAAQKRAHRPAAVPDESAPHPDEFL